MRKTILIIEDEKSIADFVIMALNLFDYDVVHAETAELGIDLALSRSPNLILCDLSLPAADGYEVLRRIRTNKPTETTPFIFVTARTERDDIRKGMSLGADDYLTKPFRIDELIASIEAQLSKKNKTVREIHDVRDQLAFAIPHEFLTPLNTVLGFCQLILWTLEDGEEMPKAELEDYIRQILDGGKRLLHLTQNYVLHAELNVLAATPASERYLGDETIFFDHEFAEDATRESLQEAERLDDIALSVQAATLKISETHLRKLIVELTDNALKFSPFRTPLIIKGIVEDNSYRLSVSDEGRGIDKSQIAKIGAFVQFDRKKHEQKGAGLGLVICKQIAEIYGGQISIDSEIDSGTVVTVVLPLSSSNKEE